MAARMTCAYNDFGITLCENRVTSSAGARQSGATPSDQNRMASWNARPEAVTQPMVSKKRVKSVSLRFLVAAVFCLCAARWW